MEVLLRFEVPLSVVLELVRDGAGFLTREHSPPGETPSETRHDDETSARSAFSERVRGFIFPEASCGDGL